MKTAILSFLLVFNFQSAFAITPSGLETNGGDAICAQFLNVFDALATNLKLVTLSNNEATALNAMIEKRKIVDLNSEPELSLNGVPKDALNYPNLPIPKIILSQKSWNRLTAAQKNQLVLHEMLPVAGFSDQDYGLSSDLMRKTINGAKRDSDIARAITTCNFAELNTITPVDILNTSFYNLPLATLSSICIPALELLVKNSWDINRCTNSGETLLKAARNNRECWNSAPSWGPERDRRRALYETFIARIVALGGTEKCNGTYEVPSWRTCEISNR